MFCHNNCNASFSNGSGVTGQASTQLEIATQMARELGHQIGYCL